ncbi:MAG: PD-(D/E)XK nuclease family protein [Verrucomicrobia bacterium]|nr:PD-(D/E)XK nuclease family protein [Verrucomicrobiota bacterium]
MTTCEPQSDPSLERLVTSLVPLLSRSLAERFNVFRVMHHGTHEKQISNVFAWLLRVDGTHGFGDVFQRIFVEQVNRGLPEESQLPSTGYRVEQEVDTSGHDALGKDIADVVLSCAQVSIVVENFESSDGHGHDYHRYLAHGTAGGRQCVVVLLCARRERHRQTDGWEQALVITYADLLEPLKAHVVGDAAWRRAHPQQLFFIRQLLEHFMEGYGIMSEEERIAFIKAMCETGESARYGHRPHEGAARQFSELLAQHAERQFEEGRKTLARVKTTLKRFAAQTLVGQANSALETKEFTSVEAQCVGQWEWCITLRRADSKPDVFLIFGPTAVVENGHSPEPLTHPDYTRVFVARQASGCNDGIDLISQTDVGLGEVSTGMSADDTRLRDAVLAAMRAD